MKIVVTRAHHPITGRPAQLGMAELMSLFTAYGIPCAAARLARSADDAVAAAEAIGFPVALKIVSPDITHKAEVGGVVLDLREGAAVHRGTGAMFGRIATTRPAAVIHGVLVQSMVPAGRELFLTGGRDEGCGPVVSVGEVFGAPATRPTLSSLAHGRTLLDEPGMAATDHHGLDRLIGRFTRLLVDRSELAEVEIDSLIVGPAGAVVVDARARIAEEQRTERGPRVRMKESR